MVSSGKPTARSQRYKANQKLLQEQARSLPTTAGSEALPPPSPVLDIPVTPDDAELRAFTSVRLLLQAMVISTRPNTNIYEMLQVVSSFFTDCEKSFHEARTRTVSVQQQLDEVNAKLLAQFEVQNAEILKLQDELEQSTIKSEFYRQQAEKADMIPPHRRRRTVHSDDTLALSTDQLYQQVLFDRDALAHRDAEIHRLQLQVLNVSADLAELRISAFEQHFDLFKDFDPEAELEEAVDNLYVPPRRIGFYQWTAKALARHDAAISKCRAEARAHASSAASAQKQFTTAQAHLAQAHKQLREAQDRVATVHAQLQAARAQVKSAEERATRLKANAIYWADEYGTYEPCASCTAAAHKRIPHRDVL
jgi:DNA repair exonuclease SbcCD ATPase subunit